MKRIYFIILGRREVRAVSINNAWATSLPAKNFYIRYHQFIFHGEE